MALPPIHHTVAERFMRYVQVDTQSDPNATRFPSTEKQKDLSRMLVQELALMGITDAEMDEYGYVYATIPATSAKAVPVICFCSHVDTSPDVSGAGVKPILHKNYPGGAIALPDDPRVVLTPEAHPALREKIGEDIITASGLTLLGADDKAGVAIIMDLAHHLMAHPEIPHGKIRILFTPDEEVGRGTEKVDLQKLGAQFGYTLDGGPKGTLEDETFSADFAEVTVYGVSAHPGYAKGHMESAIKAVADIVAALPKDRLSPETTEGKEGFLHPVSFSGVVEKASVQFILRDFDTPNLQAHAGFLQAIVDEVMKNYPRSRAELTIKEQYRNMKEVLQHHPQVVAFAEEAIRRTGLTPSMHPIRGGTDGSRLSFMGLPCPNLFAGEQGIHSLQEWVSVQDMQLAVQTLVNLSVIWEENS